MPDEFQKNSLKNLIEIKEYLTNKISYSLDLAENWISSKNTSFNRTKTCAHGYFT